MRTIFTDRANVLLDAVSANGAGEPNQFESKPNIITWQVDIVGTVTALTLTLQGSLNGVNWFDLDSYAVASNTMRHIANKSVKIVRAKLENFAYSGSGSPTPNITVSVY